MRAFGHSRIPRLIQGSISGRGNASEVKQTYVRRPCIVTLSTGKILATFAFGIIVAFAMPGCNPLGSSSVSNAYHPGVAVSLSQSVVTVATSEVAAGSSVDISVRLLDDNGQPFTASSIVELGITGGTSVGTFGPLTYNGAGIYSTTYIAAAIGSPQTIFAVVDGQRLVSDSPTVTVVQGGLSYARSFLTLSAASVRAGEQITATLIARDELGNPLAAGGAQVVFSVSPGESNGILGPVVDANNGTYVASFTGTLPGRPTTICAAINGVPLATACPGVIVLAGRPATLLALSGNDQSGVVGAQLPQDLIVQVLDALGNPVSGAQLTWEVIAGGGTLPAAAAVTDPNGAAEAQWVLGPTLITATLQVQVNNSNVRLLLGAHPLSHTPVAPRCTISGTGPQMADGNATSIITVGVRDTDGLPVEGAPLTFVATDSRGGNVYGACSVTDANGNGTCTLRSTVAEIKQLTLTAPVVNDGGNVLFVGGGPDPLATQLFVMGQQNVLANGVAQAVVGIALRDRFDNPVVGYDATQLALVSANGATLVQPTGLTNAAGETTGAVTTTVSGPIDISLGAPLPLVSVQPVQVMFVAGDGNRLVFSAAPGDGPALAPFAQQPWVQVVDDFNNVVTDGPDNDVVITLTLTAGSGTLLGQTAIAADRGSADFAASALEIDIAGSKTLTASAALVRGPQQVASPLFVIGAAQAVGLVFARQPSGAAAGVAWPQQPMVRVVDPAGNTVQTGPDSSASITLIPSAGALGGAATQSALGGVATFSGLNQTTALSGVTLSASATFVGGAVVQLSDPYDIVHAAASQLVFTTEPSAQVVVDTVLATAPVVVIWDTFGNRVDTGSDATTNIALTLPIGTGSLLGTTTLPAVGGVADFSSASLRLDGVGTNHVLRASKPDTTGTGGTLALMADALPLNVVHGPAARIAFDTQPGGGTAGAVWGQQPVVRILDGAGNPVTAGADASAQVSVALLSGTGTLLGTSTATASAGVATFTDLAMQTAGAGKTLTASKLDTRGTGGSVALTATSAAFAITPAAAAQLVMLTQPALAVAGSVWGQTPVVAVEDIYNNIVDTGPDAGATVSIALTTGVGTLLGTLSQTATAGVASFTDLADNTATPAVLTASASLQAVARQVASAPFDIVAGAGTQLVFTTQPGGGAAGEVWAQQPVLQIQDNYGNRVADGADAAPIVVLTLSQGSGTLAGSVDLSAAGGVVDFSGAALRIDIIGANKELTATATLTGGVASVVSAPFSITHGAGSRLVFTTNPSGGIAGSIWAQQPVLQILDDQNNLVTDGADATTTVTVHVASAHPLAGTVVVQAIGGVAAFTNLAENLAALGETLVAQATLSGVGTLATSPAFAVPPGPASQLAFASQPSPTSVSLMAWARQPVVVIQDALGNPITQGPDANAWVTLSLSSGAGNLAGTQGVSVQAQNGVASFAGLGLNINLVGADKVLLATKASTLGSGGTGALTALSQIFAITSGAAQSMVFATQPGGATAGHVLSPQPVLQVWDAAGNIVSAGPDAQASFSVVLASGSGTLLGTTTVAAGGGVVSFTDLQVNTAGGGKTLTVTKADTLGSGGSGALSITSDPFVVGAGTATQLAFATQPGGGVAAQPWAVQPVVQVLDAFGNVVGSGADSTASITLGRLAGSGALLGTTTESALGGVATFTDLSMNVVNAAATLQASAVLTGGAAAQTSAPFSIGAGGATQLVFTTQPGGGVSNTVWSTQPVLEVRDALGNRVFTGKDSTAWVALALTQGSGTLNGTTYLAAVGGVVDFTSAGLSLDLAGIDKQLTASANLAGVGVSDQSAVFSITHGTATQLAFATQPAGAVAGLPFATQPVVQVQDDAGNIVDSGPDAAVAIAATLGSTQPLLGNATPSAFAGIASFINLQSNSALPAENVVVQATLAGTLRSAQSANFTVAPAGAAGVAFITQPSASSASLQAFAQQPVVQIQDTFGNPVTSGPDATATITLTLTQGAGTLAGSASTAVNAAAGLANFAGSGLNIDLVGANKQLTATKADTSGSGGTTAQQATSSTFTIVHGSATAVGFSVQPVGAQAGMAFATQPQVTIEDAAGNIVDTGPDANATVALTVASGSGGLLGTSNLTASAGVAAFSNLFMDVAGVGKSLLAQKADTTSSGGTLGFAATSSPFSITPGGGAQLTFSTQPGGGAAGSAWGQQPVLRVLDGFGNLVTSGVDNALSIHLALTAGTGPLLGTTTIAAIGGVATFTNLEVDKANAGGVLTATTVSSVGALSVDSNAWAVTPAAASALIFTTQPGGGTANAPWAQQPVIDIEDAYGNLVNSGSDSAAVVGLVLSSGTGSLSGTTAQTANMGVAAFTINQLRIDVAGSNKRLAASAILAGAPVTAQSASFVVTTGQGSQLVYSTQPGGGVAGVVWAQQPVIQVIDGAGNLVAAGPDSTVQVTVTFGSGSVVFGTSTVTANGGVATFTDLQGHVTEAIDTLIATATLSQAPSTTVVSDNFSIAYGPASQVVFSTQPAASTVSLVRFAQQPVVWIQDAFGNLVTGGVDATATITLGLSQGTGTLAGDTGVALNATGGVADFVEAGLNVDLVGNDKEITATKADTTGGGGTGPLSVVTNPFAITPGAAVQVVCTTQPGGAAADALLGPQPVVTIEDAAGNVVTTGPDATASVTMALTAGPGTMLGTGTRAAVAGVATFTDLQINAAGAGHVLTATKADTTGSGGTAAWKVASNPFTVAPAGGTQLVFVAQPTGGVAGAAWFTQPVVQVQDTYGNPVTSGAASSATVTMTLSAGVGPLLGTLGQVASGGNATFTDLALHAVSAAATVTAHATLNGVSVTAVSAPFAITPAAAAQLVFTAQPGGGTSNVAWPTQPQVAIQDAYGNLVTTGAESSALITLSLTQGTGVLGGIYKLAASGGIADFSSADLAIDLAGVDKELTAAGLFAGVSRTVVSSAFAIVHSTATSIVYSVQPGGGNAGAVWSMQPVLQVQDAAGNVVDTGPDSAPAITAILGSGSTLFGTTTIQALAGAAAFTDLTSRSTDPAETLIATGTINAQVTSVISDPFAIGSAAAAQVVFFVQPSPSSVSLAAFAQQPIVQIQDSFGNLVTTGADATATITLSLFSGTGNLAGSATTSVGAQGGVADFTGAGLNIDLAGNNKVITASKADETGSGGVGVLTGLSNTLTIVHGPAMALAFTSQPGGALAGERLAPQPVLQVQDAAGNVVDTGADATASINAVQTSGTGNLLGTTGVAAVAGVVSPNDLAISVAGAGKAITFTKPDTTGTGGTIATSVASNAFAVGPAAAAQLVFTTQPALGVAGAVLGMQPVMQVQDAYGNLVTTGPDSGVTISIGLTSGTGPLLGTATATALGGVAAFTNLEIDVTNAAAVLTATTTVTGGPLSVASAPLSVVPAAASQVLFTTQPGGGVAQAAWAQQPVLSIRDSYGNVVTAGIDATAVVRLSLSQGTGTLGGTSERAAVSGIADFTGAGLNIDLLGHDKEVTATVILQSGAETATSLAFTISSGVATSLTFLTPPGGGTAGAVWPTQPVVQISDPAGNPVTTGADSSDAIAMTLGSGSALMGATAATAAGVATFAGLTSNTAEAAETLVAHATLNGVPVTVTSPTFVVLPAAAAQVVFATQPSASSVALVPFAQQPRVEIQDAFGNLVQTGADATANITLTLSQGTGTLAGVAGVVLQAIGGIADFADSALSIDRAGSNKQVTATKADTTGSGGAGVLTGVSSTFAITQGAVNQVVFSTQPGGSTAGSLLAPQPVVQIEDIAGNPIIGGPDANAQVTLSVTSGTGALLGTLSVSAVGGMATFTDLLFDLAGTKVLTATKADTTGTGGTAALGGVSSAFTITPNSAAQLVFTTEPAGAVAGATWGQQPVVTIADVYGNTVTSGPDSTVAISMTLTSGAGPLLGTTSLTASGGVATFTDLEIDKQNAAAVVTASATVTGGPLSQASSGFAVLPGAAFALVFTTPPGGGTSNIAWATQPVVEIDDAFGNRVTSGTDSTAVITLDLSQGVGTLGGTLQLGAVAGVADFASAGLLIDWVGNDKKITAVAVLNGALTAATSAVFSVVNGVGTTLSFSTQPIGATAGTLLGTQPVVQVRDAAGNLVTTGTDSTASIGLTLGSANPLLGTSTSAAAAGVATFAGLSADTAWVGETLVASATLNSVPVTSTSTPFNIVAAAASQLVFDVQPPATAVAMVPWASQPIVYIEDAFGNLVQLGADATSTITLSLTTGTGHLTGLPGTSIVAVGGVADFTDALLSIDRVGNDKVVTAEKDDQSGSGGVGNLFQASHTFAITAAGASALAFSTQPGNALAGANLSPQPVVQIQDAAGNPVTAGPDATTPVTLTLTSGSGALLGTATAAASGGVATFAGLNLQVAGVKQVTASKADTTGAGGTLAMTVVSNSFTIAPAAAAQINYTTQPNGATAGALLSQQPVLQVQDAFGNLVSTGADSSVTIVLTLNVGTLQGTLSLSAIGGVAAFTDLEIDNKVAAAQITAATTITAGSISLVSDPFAVASAAAYQLVFTRQPGGGVSNVAWPVQPQVAIEDGFGNLVTTGSDSTAVVTLSLSQGSGALAGVAQVAAVAGVADFSAAGLDIDLVGSDKKVTAAATLNGAIATATSNVFSIVNASGAALVFAIQPGGAAAGANFSPQPVVQVLDAAGNLVTTGADSTVSVTLVQSSGSPLVGIATVAAVGGVATFAGLTSHVTQAAETQVAGATVHGVPVTVTSAPYAVTPAAATQVVFTTEPSASTVALVPFAQQPAITIEDAFGNTAATGADATATITLSLASGSGTLAGVHGTTLTAVGGVANFFGSALSIDLVGANKVLRATKSDTTGGGGTASVTASSATIAIIAAGAAQIGFTTQPAGAVAGADFTQQPVITIVDAAGNPITSGADATAHITLTVSSGSGTLLGTTVVQAVAGVAAFTDLLIQRVGTTVLTASKEDTSGSGGTSAMTAISNSFVVGAAGGTQLVFVTQPAGATAGAIFAQQPVVQVQDSFGNPVTSGTDSTATVTLSLTSGSGVLQGTPALAASNGNATYTDLRIDTSNTGAVLTASATIGGTPVTVTSAPFGVAAAAASHLVFTTQPTGGVSSTAWATQPVVSIQDVYGNIVTAGLDGTSVIALRLTQGTGTLGGTYQLAAVGGVASFASAGLNIDLTGVDKELTATATVGGAQVSIVSNAFSITHGVGVALVFSTQPTGAIAGVAWGTQPVVQVLDAAGNGVADGADATASINLVLGSASALYGTPTLSATNGVASFSGLSSRSATAADTLVATATLNGAPVTATSQSFAITPGAAAQVVFTSEPSATSASLTAFAQQPVVAIEDQYGNLVNTGADATATITLALSQGTGILSGLPGTTLNAVGGIADFGRSALSVDLIGSDKIITASKSDTSGGGGTGIITGASSTFAITGGVAASLVFSTQPGSAVANANLSAQPVAQVLDAAGNLVTGGPDATASITLTLSSGSGALLGTTTVAASGGVATFGGLHMQVTGAKVLAATKADTTGTGGTQAMTALSNSFAITAAAASQLAFSTQPSGATAGSILATQPVVQVQDTYGNPVVTGADSTVAIVLGLTTGTGPLQGTASKNALAGVATFTNLRIDTKNSSAGTYCHRHRKRRRIAAGEQRVCGGPGCGFGVGFYHAAGRRYLWRGMGHAACGDHRGCLRQCHHERHR